MHQAGPSSVSKQKRIAAAIVRGQRWILACFAVLFAASAYVAPKLLNDMTDQADMDVVTGTPTADALMEFKKHFPDATGTTESLLVSCSNCSSLVSDGVGDIVKEMMMSLNKTVFDLNRTTTPGWIGYTVTYYDMPSFIEPNPFITADRKTMLFQWRWKVPGSKSAEALSAADSIVAVARRHCEEPRAQAYKLTVLLGGGLASHRDTTAANAEEPKHAVIFLPFLLCILALRVRSLTLVLVTLANVIGSMLTALAITDILAQHVNVYPLALPAICFFCVALSMDYSLFMLSRYADERRAGASYRPALVSMVANSGKVVLVSGTVLFASGLSGTALPGGFKGMALAISAACFSAMLWNIFLTPSLIGIMPGFFDYCSGWQSQRSSRVNPRLDRAVSCVASEDLMEANLKRSIWYWWTKKITVWPTNLFVVLLVLFLCSPLTGALFFYKSSIDQALSEPRGASSSAANQLIRSEFAAGPGCPSPLMLLVKPRVTSTCPNTVKSNQYFRASCELAQRIVSATQGHPYEITGKNVAGVMFHPKFNAMNSSTINCIAWNDGVFNMNPDAYSMLTGNGIFTGMTEKLRTYYSNAWDFAVSKDQVASLIVIMPRIDASTPVGYALVDLVRNILDRETADNNDGVVKPHGCGLDAYLLSSASVNRDFASASYSKYPIAVAVTLLPCFILLGCVFGAVFVPIKLLLTVAMPTFWAYGLTILVYQFGVADASGIASLAGNSGLHWSIPVMTFTFLLGLGLDYDLIVFDRIWEFRSDGYCNADAIRLGVASAGATITSAGVIFCLEMCGMLFSPVPQVDEFGLLLMAAVLIDIVVVETCLVPALLSIGADINWWPVRMPPPTRFAETPDDLPEFRADSDNEGSAERQQLLSGGDARRRNESTDSFASTTAGGVPMPFRRGDRLKVWSNSQKAWIDGVAEEVFETGGFYGDYAVMEGTVKVKFSGGAKFVRPEEFAATLRRADDPDVSPNHAGLHSSMQSNASSRGGGRRHR
eukprot:TRINITY_DN55145_c0_g1_i1.p1 TRINITY_DN55145_c0_g1~~TRINITY_DN55145_c0_g1_i1.p1  ORF type:complete len:1000 (-),score=145.07 TRINITY_DN55145_c0_g1_i1:62-3061(-)